MSATVRDTLETVDRLVSAALGCPNDDETLLLYLEQIAAVTEEITTHTRSGQAGSRQGGDRNG